MPAAGAADLKRAAMEFYDLIGRVVEHWDVLQPIPAEAKNDNGMF